MKFLRVLAVGVMVSAAVFGACTSSNSPTNISTNSSYDNQYRDQTRSANNQNNPLDEVEGEIGDPPITLMLLAMETGDVYPGNDYFIYLVDDNPDGRGLEYEWSVGNGDFFPVAEADRGRLRTLVEDEYNTAQPELPPVTEAPAGEMAGGAFSDGPAGLAAEAVPPGQQAAGGTQPAVQQPAPGAQQPAAGGQQAPASNSGNQQDLNVAGVPAGQSSDTAPPDGNTNDDLFSNVGGSGSTNTGGSNNNSGSGDTNTTPDTNQDRGDDQEKGKGYDVSMLLGNEREYDLNGETFMSIIPGGLDRYPNGNPFPPELMEIMQKIANKEPLTEDDIITFKATDKYLREYDELVDLGNQQRDSAVPDGYIMRNMVIAGQAVIDDEGRRSDNQVAGNVVDKSIENATALLEEQLGEELPAASTSTPAPDRDSRGLRYEYQTWQEDGSEPRRRGLGGYGVQLDDEDPLLEEESYERYSLITDEPYIEWTPRRPGKVNIYVRAMYHGEYVTDARRLEVEVRLRDPEIELVKDFPDIVREDEAVYVRIDGSNLPDFDKGLFTLSYDNTKLSFREAELGEFFDDYADASIYYAQPNKEEGKVLLAVDSNTMVSEPSGDGALVYIKFKAKEDLQDSDESQLSMVMDTSARYILNKEGENILPLPLNLPPWRTEMIMPPDLPNYERQNTPGTEADSQPAGGNRTPPGAQAPGSQAAVPSGDQTTQTNTSGTQGSTGFNQDAGFLSSGGSSRPTVGSTPGTNTTGGNTTGGNTTGGNTTGGNTTGGNTTGGDTTGGNTTGGNTTGGDGGTTVPGRAQSDAEKAAAAEAEAEAEKAAQKENANEDDPAPADKPDAEPGSDDPAPEPDEDPEEPAGDPPADDPAKQEDPPKDPPLKDE